MTVLRYEKGSGHNPAKKDFYVRLQPYTPRPTANVLGKNIRIFPYAAITAARRSATAGEVNRDTSGATA
jgi:hypothetical protein